VRSACAVQDILHIRLEDVKILCLASLFPGSHRFDAFAFECVQKILGNILIETALLQKAADLRGFNIIFTDGMFFVVGSQFVGFGREIDSAPLIVQKVIDFQAEGDAFVRQATPLVDAQYVGDRVVVSVESVEILKCGFSFLYIHTMASPL